MSDCGRCGADLELDDYGMPVQHLCCGCQDTGRVRYRRARYDPGFGKAHHCPECRR